jgi:hypothetical protein
MYEITGRRDWSGLAESTAWVLMAGFIILLVAWKGGNLAAALLLKLYEIFY